MARAVEAPRYRPRSILHTVRQRHMCGVSHLRGRQARLRPSGPHGSFSGRFPARTSPTSARSATHRPDAATWRGLRAIRDRCSVPSSAWCLPHAPSSREVILRTLPGWVLPPNCDSRHESPGRAQRRLDPDFRAFAFDDRHSRCTGAPELKRRIRRALAPRGYGQLSAG
jgi:hypothetical protein